MPAPTRPLVPRTRCGHHVLIRVVPRELTAGGSGDNVYSLAAPMTVTYDIQSTKPILFGANQLHAPMAERGTACSTRGSASPAASWWYCRSPKDIPIGPAFNSERHVLPSQGFR